MTLVNKHDLVNLIENIAPKDYAIKYDNPGLHTGSLSDELSRCLVTLDVTYDVIKEAREIGADMIISHHPLFMEPPKSLSKYHLPEYVLDAVKSDITIYSCHTNYDASPELGVNHALLSKLGLDLVSSSPLEPTYESRNYKVVIFVPKDHHLKLHSSISEVGAGFMGNYSHVSFQTSGTGTFCPLPGSSPNIGQINQINQVKEVRIETIVSEEYLSQVLKTINEVHPYEEPAYDIFPLHNSKEQIGLGLAGTLKEPIEGEQLIDKIRCNLSSNLNMAGPIPDNVKKLAVCGGSGGKLIDKAVQLGMEVLITGDVKYHEAQSASEQGLMVIDAGHMETELPAIDQLADYLNEQLADFDTEVLVSCRQKSVFYR